MSAAVIVQAAVVIADTINTVVNAADRRKFQQAFAMLDESQQIDLAGKLAAAKDNLEKSDIIAKAYYDFTIAQNKNRLRQQTVQYIIIVSVTLVLLGTVIIYKNSNRE